jgi:hypothetical protein
VIVHQATQSAAPEATTWAGKHRMLSRDITDAQAIHNDRTRLRHSGHLPHAFRDLQIQRIAQIPPGQRSRRRRARRDSRYRAIQQIPGTQTVDRGLQSARLRGSSKDVYNEFRSSGHASRGTARILPKAETGCCNQRYERVWASEGIVPDQALHLPLHRLGRCVSFGQVKHG